MGGICFCSCVRSMGKRSLGSLLFIWSFRSSCIISCFPDLEYTPLGIDLWFLSSFSLLNSFTPIIICAGLLNGYSSMSHLNTIPKLYIYWCLGALSPATLGRCYASRPSLQTQQLFHFRFVCWETGTSEIFFRHITSTFLIRLVVGILLLLKLFCRRTGK